MTLLLPGQPPYQAPLYGVYGKDIKDLQVIESVENLERHHVLDQPSSFQPDKVSNTIYLSNECQLTFFFLQDANTYEIHVKK